MNWQGAIVGCDQILLEHMIAIDGYLNQAKLEAALKAIVGSASWKGCELTVPGTRRRWDMAYTINGRTTVVEFDGDLHYRDSMKIKIDLEKDKAAERQGYAVVRFPYWLQLTEESLTHFSLSKQRSSKISLMGS